MQRCLRLAIIKLLFSVYCVFTCLPVKSQTHLPRTVTINSKCGGYYEYLPVNYSSNTSTKYPLIIYLHGGASYGNGTASALSVLLKYEGIPYYINNNLFPPKFALPNGDTTSFIVISPQFKSIATPLEIKQVIDYILAQGYRIDLSRVYLTGYSIGGNEAWQAPYNTAAAFRLAALAPAAGYNNPYADTTARFIAGANLPVWAIHSNSDGTITVNASIDMVNKINSFNPAIPAIITRLTNVTHDTTVLVAFNPQFRPNGKSMYEWFLQYKRIFPPVANAGSDIAITLPASSVTLSGSNSSDPQGGPLSYNWTKISGPSPYSISNAADANPVVSNLIAGVYNFKLAVTNNVALASFDTVSVRVINPNPNKLPVAMAGNDQTVLLPQTTTSLDGSASFDPDGIVESYAWSKIAGPAQFTISNPSSVNTTVTNLKAGTYQFQLTVKDNQDSIGRDTIQINVINPFPNILPVANAGADQSITLPVNSVALTGSASSDLDGIITGYQWRLLNGPSPITIVNPNSANATAGNLVAGIYQFELKVTDDSSAVARDTVVITVNPASKFIKVNVYGGTYPAGAGWNNWNVQNNLSSTKFIYADSTPSSVTAVLSSTLYTVDNGAGYPVTMCPPEVGRTASYNTIARTLTISGLDSNKRYDFEAYASRIGGTPTKYTIGSSSTTIITDRNYSNKAVFTNISPSAGKIVVKIDVVTSFAYINGFTLTENSYVGPANTNAPPVSVPGPDQSINLPLRQVVLNGSGSYDPNGSVTAYNWQQLSGPTTASITNPNAASATASGLDSGVYVFQLTVTDNAGAIATNTLKVTVGSLGYSNMPPVANAGSDITIDLPVDSVQLNGSGSKDPDGTIVTYNWSKIAGPARFTISNTSIINPNLTNLFAGVYQFELSVSDNYGLRGKDTVLVNVTVSVPQPPVSVAGPDVSITLPANYTQLNGSASYDKDGTVAVYRWNKVSGPASFTINDSSLVSPQVSDLVAGAYIFELVVTDNNGLTGKDSVTVMVNPNQPPIAVAGNNASIVLPANSIQLNGNGSSDPDGTVVSYSWAKLSGPASFSISNSTAINPVISNLTKGIYLMELTVTDNFGATAKNSVTITVYPPPNRAPVSNAGPDQSIVVPANAVILNGSASSDADGFLISYHWRQLNGPSTSVIGNPDSVSTTAGNLLVGVYQFELQVTDDSSAIGRDTVLVTVNAAQKFIKVNVYGGVYPAGAGWNNWNVQSNLASAKFSYSDGAISAVSAVLSSTIYTVDNGAGYPVTMCPLEVGRTSSYSTIARTLTISGLDNTKRYDFEAYASRIGGYPTKYTIGSTSVTVATDRNYSNKAAFTNIAPSAGKITVNIDVVLNFAYLNGFTLTENSSTVTTASSIMNSNGVASASLLQDSVSGQLGVFPNPFNNQFWLQIKNQYTGRLRISLMNQSGLKLKEFEFMKESANFGTTIPLHDLPKGVYFMQAQMADWRQTIKLIKR